MNLSDIKKKVRERDRYCCQICGAPPSSAIQKRGTKRYIISMDVHHIFESDNNTMENLLTVCRPCHRLLDKMRRGDKSDYSIFIESAKSKPKTAYCPKCLQPILEP